jgi:hypothetical protein
MANHCEFDMDFSCKTCKNKSWIVDIYSGQVMKRVYYYDPSYNNKIFEGNAINLICEHCLKNGTLTFAPPEISKCPHHTYFRYAHCFPQDVKKDSQCSYCGVWFIKGKCKICNSFIIINAYNGTIECDCIRKTIDFELCLKSNLPVNNDSNLSKIYTKFLETYVTNENAAKLLQNTLIEYLMKKSKK